MRIVKFIEVIYTKRIKGHARRTVIKVYPLLDLMRSAGVQYLSSLEVHRRLMIRMNWINYNGANLGIDSDGNLYAYSKRGNAKLVDSFSHMHQTIVTETPVGRFYEILHPLILHCVDLISRSEEVLNC